MILLCQLRINCQTRNRSLALQQEMMDSLWLLEEPMAVFIFLDLEMHA